MTHLEGFDLVSNSELQETQELLDLEDDNFGPDGWKEAALRICAFVFLIKKFFALACSLKRTRIKFSRNHRAALAEPGMMELPWICIVRVE